jgi:hypothetical protein
VAVTRKRRRKILTSDYTGELVVRRSAPGVDMYVGSSCRLINWRVRRWVHRWVYRWMYRWCIGGYVVALLN